MADSRFGNYSSCCRLCLTDKYNSLNNIYTEYGDAEALCEKIVSYTGIQISKADKLTTLLCDKCFLTINNWDDYKKQCVSNQSKLEGWMESWNENIVNHVKDEPVDEEVPPEVISIDEEEDTVVVKPEPIDAEELEEFFDIPQPALSPNILECNVEVIENGSVTQSNEAEIDQGESSNSTQSNGLIAPEKDHEKIEFAAGLCLQSKGSTPTPTTQLTKIEQTYLEKCRIMISMFHKVRCACHNQSFDRLKKLLGHLRLLYSWFPPYTCYNCLVTFDGRSARMRHVLKCPQSNLESLIRLSELRARTDDKIRLYQNFKCTMCNYLFGFYDDYCEHVDTAHVLEDGPYTCLCLQNFDNSDLFRQHIHKTCYLHYYCDICFILTSSLEEFTQHCEHYHDVDDDFQFMPIHPNFMILNNIAIGNILLENKANRKVPKTELSLLESTFETTMEEYKAEPDRKQIPIYNPLKTIKMKIPQNQTDCTHCDKTYSNYHNMLRHLKSFHRIEPLSKTERVPCDVCGLDFSSYGNMMRHRRVHAGDNVECVECTMQFNSNSELAEHMQMAHPGIEDTHQIIRCEECGESFKNELSLDLHMDEFHCTVCQECGEEFATIDELEQHRSVHQTITLANSQEYANSSPDQTCHICDITFQNDDELQAHMQLHDKMPTLELEEGEVQGIKQLECKECNKFYNNSRSLWVHNKKYHPEKSGNRDFPKDCNLCDRTISNMAGWVMHRQMHERAAQKIHGKIPQPKGVDESDYHTCKRCFKVFASRYNLKTHMKCHGITLSPSRTQTKGGKFLKTIWCDICHQACQGLSEYNRHKQEHLHEDSPDLESQSTEDEITINKKLFSIKVESGENSVQVYCKYCKIMFHSVDSLNMHMEEEHDELIKPKINKITKAAAKFCCDICRKTFTSLSALSSHQGWHKRTKVERVFQVQEKMYKKALNNVAKPKMVLNYKCSTCMATFEDNTSLQLHILETHRNINATAYSSKCGKCNMEFKSQGEYDMHLQFSSCKQKESKTGVLCRYCNRVFSRSDYLNIHISRKHPEYAVVGTYKCNQCGRVFEKQNALTIHLKVHERIAAGGATSSAVAAPPAAAGSPKVFKYSCSICHLGFDIPKELRNHIITSHPF